MSTIRRRRRGATLIELTVASFLALLILTAAYELMVPGLRTWASTNERGHLQQQALAAVTRVQHDLKLTCIDSIVIDTLSYRDGVHASDEAATQLSFASPVGADGAVRVREDGSLVWQHHVVVYLEPSRHELRIGERPFVSGEEEVLRLEHFTPAAEDRVFARQVCGFLVETSFDTVADHPVRINPISVTRHPPAAARTRSMPNKATPASPT